MTTATEKKAAEKTTVKAVIGDRFGNVRGVTSTVASTTVAVGKSYFSGVGSVGKALFGFGREAAEDSIKHVQALTKATCLRNAAEMQVAFMQNRIDSAADHAKELTDLARVKSEETIKPLVELLDQKKAA